VISMKQTGNLPEWPGASEVYSRAYGILEEIQQKFMAGNTSDKTDKGWKAYVKKSGWPPEEVRGLVAALNRGDEEFLKGAILQYRDFGYLPCYTGE
jgi:hypothetical protein